RHEPVPALLRRAGEGPERGRQHRRQRRQHPPVRHPAHLARAPSNGMVMTWETQDRPEANGLWVTGPPLSRKARGTIACPESGVREKAFITQLRKTRTIW